MKTHFSLNFQGRTTDKINRYIQCIHQSPWHFKCLLFPICNALVPQDPTVGTRVGCASFCNSDFQSARAPEVLNNLVLSSLVFCVSPPKSVSRVPSTDCQCTYPGRSGNVTQRIHENGSSSQTWNGFWRSLKETVFPLNGGFSCL